MLLLFGGTNELNETKKELANQDPTCDDPKGSTLITASPLDYHLFRQEITSKYPAYNPPQPLLPFELENNSILPPLPTASNRPSNSHGPLSGIGPADFNNSGGSIIHQPVHIATPAPSPPPSPAGPGGKAGKKQNYQTNQNFPFLYPPSDSSSAMDTQGSLSTHKNLVGKPWEGSDVPESILEAGELFANRTRMTRATRQLWDERERFIRFERGWENSTKPRAHPNTGLDHEAEDLEQDSNSNELSKRSNFGKEERSQEESSVNRGPDSQPQPQPAVQRRLDAVDQFYVRKLDFGFQNDF